MPWGLFLQGRRHRPHHVHPRVFLPPGCFVADAVPARELLCCGGGSQPHPLQCRHLFPFHSVRGLPAMPRRILLRHSHGQGHMRGGLLLPKRVHDAHAVRGGLLLPRRIDGAHAMRGRPVFPFLCVHVVPRVPRRILLRHSHGQDNVRGGVLLSERVHDAHAVPPHQVLLHAQRQQLHRLPGEHRHHRGRRCQHHHK